MAQNDNPTAIASAAVTTQDSSTSSTRGPTIMKKLSSIFLLSGLFLLLLVPNSGAQSPIEKPSNDEIAKALANPNTPLATMRLKNLYTFYTGDLPGAGDQSNYSMLFQPSFPFPLGDNGSLIFWRPALPILFEQPIFDPATGSFDERSGLGDIAMDIAYGNTSDAGIITALGMVTTVPTATNKLGKEQWLLGPEVLLGKLTSDYVVGVFPSHQWSIAGEDSFDTSITALQVFATVLPGGGWAMGASPIMTYDWEAEQWTIPLNLTVSKTVQWGSTPFKLDLTLDYYVEKNDAFGPEWVVGLNVAPVVENVLAGLFGGK